MFLPAFCSYRMAGKNVSFVYFYCLRFWPEYVSEGTEILLAHSAK
jgi:hypothetical protein